MSLPMTRRAAIRAHFKSDTMLKRDYGCGTISQTGPPRLPADHVRRRATPGHGRVKLYASRNSTVEICEPQESQHSPGRGLSIVP